jgi:hypothetical protein
LEDAMKNEIDDFEIDNIDNHGKNVQIFRNNAKKVVGTITEIEGKFELRKLEGDLVGYYDIKNDTTTAAKGHVLSHGNNLTLFLDIPGIFNN